jgi:hypothetical protein
MKMGRPKIRNNVYKVTAEITPNEKSITQVRQHYPAHYFVAISEDHAKEKALWHICETWIDRQYISGVLFDVQLVMQDVIV